MVMKNVIVLGTLQDVVNRLGNVPLHRIGIDPPPGLATEADVIRHLEGDSRRLFELVDSTLVEKAMGTPESVMSSFVLRRLGQFAEDNDLGIVCAGDGPVRMIIGNIRIPDVSFFSWESLIGDEFPSDKICPIAPTLAVEVLSQSNTEAEIAQKRIEFFKSGTRLMWIIDPDSQTAEIYTKANRSSAIDASGSLDGGRVLPGFRLPLADVFQSLNRKPHKRKGR